MGFVTSPYPLLKNSLKKKQTNKKKTSYYITRPTSTNVC
jgi:hypothetical protein